MLENYPGTAALPAQDMERAQAYYEEKLGLKPAEERSDGLIYKFAEGSFLLFKSSGEPSGTHTQFGWIVDDIDSVVSELRANGVVFEEYDFPGFKTENGILTTDDGKGAWFKDSEGNLLSIGEGF